MRHPCGAFRFVARAEHSAFDYQGTSHQAFVAPMAPIAATPRRMIYHTFNSRAGGLLLKCRLSRWKPGMPCFAGTRGRRLLWRDVYNREHCYLPPCPTPLMDSPHRVMRWTCCDKSDPGTWGSSGCKTRCHLPPFDGHPDFVDIVRKVPSNIYLVVDKVMTAR